MGSEQICKEELINWVKNEGFLSVKIFNPFDYKEKIVLYSYLNSHISADSVKEILRPECSVLMAAFPYICDNPGTESADFEPSGLIAPFARGNYYKEAVKRLRNVSKKIREKTDLCKKDIRVFANSRYPEKLFASLAGVGFHGKNSLIITKEAGSLCILAGMIIQSRIKADIYPDGCDVPGRFCGSCSRCIDKCPTKAITQPGIIDANLCIQSLSAKCIMLSEEIMEVWGTRIYGCQVCQDVCPFNKNCKIPDSTYPGNLVRSIPLKQILKGEFKEILRGTAMGMPWIDPLAIIRNGIIAAGNIGTEELIPFIKPYLQHKNHILVKTAQRSIKKILNN